MITPIGLVVISTAIISTKVDTMRLALLAIVVFFGSIIGCSAINTVSKMQDSKMSRFCESIPVGASYDDICRKYKHQSN